MNYIHTTRCKSVIYFKFIRQRHLNTDYTDEILTFERKETETNIKNV